MGSDDLPITIVYSSAGAHIQGNIAKINPTGMLIELEQVPFHAGQVVQVLFSLPGHGELRSDAKPIKIYKNYKKRIKVETDSGTVMQEVFLKLAELHFFKPPANLRDAIMKHLMNLQVSILKQRK